MKKILSPVLICFLLSEPAFAQWDSVGIVEANIQLTSPYTGYYYWNESGGTPSNPKGIGHLMKSTDGWDTWTEIFSIGSMTAWDAGSIWGLNFINDTVGGMGCNLMGFSGLDHTTNGGNTWTSIAGGEPGFPFCFVRANYGYFQAYSTSGHGFYRYDNGQTIRLDTAGYISVFSVYFINDSIGFRKPYGENAPYYRTADYGYNWEVTCDSSLSVGKIVFPTSRTGYYVTTSGALFTSSDMGATWLPVTTIPLSQVNDLFFLDSARGWAGGNNGLIIKTTTSGATWETVPTTSNDNIFKIAFFSDEVGYYISEHQYSWDNIFCLYRTNIGPWGNGQQDAPAPIRIVPNPARIKLNLICTIPEIEIEQMAIFTIYGSLILSSNRFVNEIDISSLAAGLYLLRYSAKGKTWAEKFIVAD